MHPAMQYFFQIYTLSFETFHKIYNLSKQGSGVNALGNESTETLHNGGLVLTVGDAKPVVLGGQNLYLYFSFPEELADVDGEQIFRLEGVELSGALEKVLETLLQRLHKFRLKPPHVHGNISIRIHGLAVDRCTVGGFDDVPGFYHIGQIALVVYLANAAGYATVF